MSQDTDFQIPNGTGQAVRLDLQTAILALASLSSGSQSGLGTTQPCQLFADTTNGLLKIRDTGGNAAAAQATFHTIGSLNTANLGLLPRSGGTMTGVITGSTGSAAAPSINFGDSSTGIFKESTNVLGITGAGNLSFGHGEKLHLQVRDNLRTIPDRISPIVAAEDDPAKIHNIITNEIRDCLEGLKTIDIS